MVQEVQEASSLEIEEGFGGEINGGLGVKGAMEVNISVGGGVDGDAQIEAELDVEVIPC